MSTLPQPRSLKCLPPPRSASTLTKAPLTKTASKPGANANAPAQSSAGLGIVMLLLAAIPFDHSSWQSPSAISPEANCGYQRTFHAPSNLQYCVDMLNPKLCQAAEELLEAEKKRNSELEEEERRRRRQKKGTRSAEGNTSPQGISSESEPESEGGVTAGSPSDSDYETMTTSNVAALNQVRMVNVRTKAPLRSMMRSSSAAVSASASSIICDGDLSSDILSYLPLQDLLACKKVCQSLARSVEAVLPSHGDGTVFIRFRAGTTNRGKKFTVAPQRNALRWTCSACSSTNHLGQSNCRQCGDSALNGLGIRRVFVGQLRKDNTAELVEWLVAMIYPDIELFHVENHTNGLDGRGKGCAWVYLSNRHDEERLLSLNKRMFVDLDDERQEGLWFVEPAKIDELNNTAAARAYRPGRPLVLARQPLVIERPQAKPNDFQNPKPAPAESASAHPPRATKGHGSSARNSNAHAKVERTAQELYELHRSQEQKSVSAKVPPSDPVENDGETRPDSVRRSHASPVPKTGIQIPLPHPTSSFYGYRNTTGDFQWFPDPPAYRPSHMMSGSGHGIRLVNNGTSYIHDPYSLVVVY